MSGAQPGFNLLSAVKDPPAMKPPGELSQTPRGQKDCCSTLREGLKDVVNIKIVIQGYGLGFHVSSLLGARPEDTKILHALANMPS
eukprot:Em0001g1365a